MCSIAQFRRGALAVVEGRMLRQLVSLATCRLTTKSGGYSRARLQWQFCTARNCKPLMSVYFIHDRWNKGML
jgi:hypothetical protein